MSDPLHARPEGEGGVRRAGHGDLDDLAALWTGLAEHHRPLDPLYALRPDAGRAIRRLLAASAADPDAAVFVYEEAGEALGFCVVRIDRAPPIFEETRRGEITDLGVRPEHRRSGVGSALAKAALSWVEERGCRRVEVRVAARNAEGQAFWRALGFGELVDVLQRRL